MYIVSKAFIEAMKTHTYAAKLTLDGGDVIQGDAIQEIVFRGGANGETDAFTLGGTVASSAEISLDKTQVPSVAHGRQIKVELAMGAEWIPMGVYYVTEPLADDDRLTVTACDALAAKFDREFEVVEGFDFAAEGGVSSTAFLVALCGRRGVQVDISGLNPIALNGAPDGFTERQIIGFIAALYGGFAWIDRTGVLKIRTFSKTEVKVTADDYYDSGMEKAGYTFSAQWIKCYNEISDLTMVLGDVSAQQGIYLESIWMNSAILQGLWKRLQGFSYVPVTELSFLGNPLLDPGDIITMEDLSGVSVDVPVMRITHEYDGGVITRVTANGQAETSSPAGPLGQQLRRIEVKAKTYSGVALDDAKSYADDLDKALDQLEVLKRLTAENVDDAIYMTEEGKLAIKATAILTGVLDAALVTVKNLVATNIVSGRLKSKDGKSYFDLDTGEIVSDSGAGYDMRISAGRILITTPTSDSGTRKAIGTISFGVTNDGKDCSPLLLLNQIKDGNILSTVQILDGSVKVHSPNGHMCLIGVTENGARVYTDSINLSGNGNCQWEYIQSIGKTVLVQQ